jgi:hypothetical protein
MSKVALVLIYNHHYPQNIDTLNNYYSKQFSNIYHLVPFYKGSKKNVIPVYENSFYFQGYISQGLKHFYTEDYNDYIFAADDLLLNPEFNENNYAKKLSLPDNACFISELIGLNEGKLGWMRLKEAVAYKIQKPGIEVQTLIPSFRETALKFNSFGFGVGLIKAEYVLREKMTEKDKNVMYATRYPLLGGHSDFFVVSKQTIREFSHFCGVFAATDLFVELAVPTAMVLTANKIITETALTYKIREKWSQEQYDMLAKQCENRVSKLLNNFPDNFLYIHPVKFSKWINDL